MFSEYASRFLAQSQSRLSLSQAGDPSSSRGPLDRHRGGGSRVPSRAYLQRQPFASPYQNTGNNNNNNQNTRFPFASRLSNTPAPLFYSATDDFREEDDNEEHEREVADFYALQRSRRDFAPNRITDSSGSEGAGGDIGERARGPIIDHGTIRDSRFSQSRGIRSSWNGDDDGVEDGEKDETSRRRGDIRESSINGSALGKTRDHLVDVNLASTIHEEDEEVHTGSFGASQEFSMEVEDAPSVQQLRTRPAESGNLLSKSRFFSQETDRSTALANPPPRSPSEDTSPVTLAAAVDPPRHDVFWSTLFLTSLASVFATFLLVCLHTYEPKDRMGDTVYTALHSSFYLLGVDTFIAVIIALLWLAALRSFVRPLVYLILIGVPVISFAFGLLPFISSFKGGWHGTSVQDRAMRWTALIPLLFSIGWVFTAYKSRHSLHRAIELLEFSLRILSTSPPLIAVGFGTLGALVAWTWVWMLMFTRVFLGGRLSKTTHLFIINTGTWWLGVFFVLVYLWTLGIVSGIQRAITAATVSQWYFHRLVTPAPSSQKVVAASCVHATTVIFGTICLSTLLSLAVRLPLLLLPRRLGTYVALFFYTLVPTSIAVLTNPLTLTYAAIHSQPLTISARGLAEMSFISSTSPTNTLTPAAVADTTFFSFQRSPSGSNGRSAASSGSGRLRAYRLAKLLLHSTRLVTALAFGIGGWVTTARSLQISGQGVGYRGSLYAYVVGFIAGAIGWTVLGAVEGVLGGVLDAVVVCWGSETRDGAKQGQRFCREADELLSEGEDRYGNTRGGVMAV